MRKLEKQWTLTKGVETRKPVMWSSRAQMQKYAALKRSLKAASSTSEASRRSTEEYSASDDDYSVTPDTDDIASETTSQYEVTDEWKQSHVPHGTLKIRVEPLVPNHTKTQTI